MYVVGASLQTDTPIMLIDQHIGFDEEQGMGIDGSAFQRELLELDGMGFKSIQVWINSPGGTVMDGYCIFNAILNSKTPVDTFCVGMAASIACVIFEAGRKRIMSDYGRLMVHNPSGGDDKKSLDAIRSSLVTMLSKRSGIKEEDIEKLMNKTTWIDPQEALEMGLCDSIQQSEEVNKKRAQGSKNTFHKNCNLIINSTLQEQFPNENLPKMENNIQAKATLSLVANYLGLSTEATEESILNEVKNRLNREVLNRKKAEDDADDLKEQMKELKEKMDKAKAEYDALKNEMDELKKKAEDEKAKAKKEKEDAEEEARKEKAKNMVELHVRSGRIKNEASTIAKWTDLATADFDGTKKLIEDLPLNGRAPVMQMKTDGNAPNPAEVPMNAAMLMAKVAMKHNQAVNA